MKPNPPDSGTMVGGGDCRVPASPSLAAFVTKVAAEGAALYRDFAWRRTSDPYEVLVSEIMLQQTQVSRVERYYERWLDLFPTLQSLAAAPLEAVLVAWQGLGYNRRAIALKKLAEKIVAEAAPGEEPALPSNERELTALPGIGPATASGVRAFAFSLPSVYLETNVRSVFLHELFADSDDVSDAQIRPLVEAAGLEAEAQGIGPRTWNYALLDYGAHLKKILPNPSRRSRHHTRQSTFEGSNRQKRARLLRLVMGQPGQTLEAYAVELALAERSDGREAPSTGDVLALLEALTMEGFLASDGAHWWVA